jgi:hypothetical protein
MHFADSAGRTATSSTSYISRWAPEAEVAAAVAVGDANEVTAESERLPGPGLRIVPYVPVVPQSKIVVDADEIETAFRNVGHEPYQGVRAAGIALQRLEFLVILVVSRRGQPLFTADYSQEWLQTNGLNHMLMQFATAVQRTEVNESTIDVLSLAYEHDCPFVTNANLEELTLPVQLRRWAVDRAASYPECSHWRFQVRDDRFELLCFDV